MWSGQEVVSAQWKYFIPESMHKYTVVYEYKYESAIFCVKLDNLQNA